MEYLLAQLGVAVFAVSGVLSAAQQRLDIFSIVVVGLLTAIGGGTLRDVILDVPVFWLEDMTAFWVAMAASFATFLGIRLILRLPSRLLSYLDALGVALFAVQAIDKTLAAGYPAAVAVVMGLITGIAGAFCAMSSPTAPPYCSLANSMPPPSFWAAPSMSYCYPSRLALPSAFWPWR